MAGLCASQDELDSVVKKLEKLDLESENRLNNSVEGLLTFDDYNLAVKNGEIRPFAGSSSYTTAKDKYDDGWAFCLESHRWKKTKSAKPESDTTINTMRQGIMEALSIIKRLPVQPPVIIAHPVIVPLPILVPIIEPVIVKEVRKSVYLIPDTNIFLYPNSRDMLLHIIRIIREVVGKNPTSSSISVIIPKEVISELENLKHREKRKCERLQANQSNSKMLFEIRQATHSIHNLLGLSSGSLIIRGQMDNECVDASTTHDNAIIDCGLYFSSQMSSSCLILTQDSLLSLQVNLRQSSTLRSANPTDREFNIWNSL